MEEMSGILKAVLAILIIRSVMNDINKVITDNCNMSNITSDITITDI